MTGASESSEARSFRYRPGLDGVRALAVAAVILYHGEVSWAKGGFLGVDVFFVLSGFLITSLLLRELEHTGGIALTAFWIRRIRRLLPALFLLLAAVALYAVVWAQPTELTTIRGDGLASLFYVSNWRFIASGASYFQAFQSPSPLTHTWSLAIEEQWYLFWPLAMLLMMRVFRGRTQAVAAAIVGLAACSALAMAVMFQPGGDPSRVYYGTDTRAQALLVGAAFASLTSGLRPAIHLDRLRRPWILQLLGITGAVVVGTMVVRVDSAGTFLYRGGFLIAAIAAVLFVGAASVDGPLASVLSIKPLVAIGMISYGLYLWHWPIDVLLDERRTGLEGFALFAVRIAVTGVIATASYFFVERPIRRNGLAPLGAWARARVRPAIVAVTAALLALLLVVSTEGATSAPSLAAIAKANQTARKHRDPSKPRILFLGDSQALSLIYHGTLAFLASGSQYLYKPVIGCGVFDVTEKVGGNCAGRERMWNTQVRTFDPDLSVLEIGAWEALDFKIGDTTYVHGTPEHEQELERIVATAVEPLTRRSGKVALLEVPCFGANEGDARADDERNSAESVANVNNALRAVALRSAGRVAFVSWADSICPGGRYTEKVNGITVRPDGVHVGSKVAATLITDQLVPVFDRLAREAREDREDGLAASRGWGMKTYNVVVGGAGSAGAVLAARCSEDPDTSVLLLEAGPDHDSAGTPAGVRAPNFFGAVFEPGRIWTELVATRAPGQAEAMYVRGRGAGGSSSVNAMGAIRGTVDDYERWASELGCRGWGWPEMLGAFLRVEDDADYGGDAMHGKGGPIPLGRLSFDALPPLDLALRAAMTDLGYPVCDDYHAPDATGVSRMALTLRDGKRVSTNDGYLERARQRPNLEVRGDVLVDRVLLDGTRATGVLTASGEEIGAREVFVSAGAIHSPAILLRSGVGDGGRPVGGNLKEHAATPGFEIALKPEGRMTSANAPLFSSMLRYSSELAGAGPNDMQMIWFGAAGPTDDTLVGGRLLGAVMRVFSSGEVRLRSHDPLVDPVVEFNMLSDERDLIRLRDCVHRMIDVVRAPSVQAISDGVVALVTPLDDLDGDDAIDAWLIANVTDYVHAVGTCRMGAVDDPAAVVDTDCRVIGYEGLRVCDASVMPDLPKANTHLTTVAIAERLIERMRS